ncbi:MAG TPA: hypothetical protein VGQ33_24665, partial [Vicinamibacteria bacterium]|nr:hypothetical protein [Vicinamibacteria bacterium]
AAYSCLWLVVGLGNLVLDYAKVLCVLGDDDSRPRRPRFVFAVARALGLVARHPAATIGLYAATAVGGVLLLAGYVAVVPGSGTASGAAVAGTFALGQLFVLSRVLLRATFVAGEVLTASALLGTEAMPERESLSV